MTRIHWHLKDGLKGSRIGQNIVGLFSQGLQTESLWRNAAADANDHGISHLNKKRSLLHQPIFRLEQ